MVPALFVTLIVLLQVTLSYTAVPPLKVEISPKKPLFRVGDKQELTCRMNQCSEKMSFSWGSLQDKPLYAEAKTSSDKSTLVFKSVNKNNENTIQCRATCNGMPKQASVNVRVYSFPKAPVISGHDSLVLGKENTMTCEVSDVYPAEYMTVKWLRGGEVVHTQDGEYGIESIQSKYILTPQTNNTGELITCRATLDLPGLPQEERTRETAMSMTVLCPPVNTVISVFPNNPKEKEFMNISCVSDSNDMSQLVLSKVQDGKETELMSGSGPQVSVFYPNTNLNHSGVYVCKTTHACGRQTTNVTITVGTHPLEVSLHPNTSFIPVQRGGRMTLFCNSSGCPHAHITWKNVTHRPLLSWNDAQTFVSRLGPWIVGLEDNGTFICEVECGSVVKSMQTEVKVFFYTKSVKSVNKNNENTIQCRATCNGMSKQASVNVRVYSFPKAPVISGHDSLVLGKENTMTCEVSDVYPAEYMTVEWLRGGEVVHTQDGEYGIESIQSKYILTPQTNNTGELITCRATLDLPGLPQEERTRETAMSMTVLCPPVNTVISVFPNNPKEKEFMNISCVSDSNDMSQLVLSKVQDGKETELMSGSGPQVSVFYPNTNLNHSGVYVCKTTHACGRQTTNVTITVGTHPLEVSLHPNTSFIPVQRGGRMTLFCNSSGCPHAHITWKNVTHRPLLSWNDAQTFVSRLGPWIVGLEDNGTFICEVECGSVVKSMQTEVKVFSFPKAPVISGHDSLVLGKENTMTCEVSDVYPAEYMTVEWLRGGEVVHTQDGEYGIESIQSKYILTPQTNNTGELITCRATLDLPGLPQEERTRETAMSMTVLSFPSDPTIESSGPFLEGKVTNLTCTVREVFPANYFYIQWLDGEFELSSVHGNMADKPQNLSLTIPFKPKASDQNKTLTCKVSLGMEGVPLQKTASTTLTVHYSPKSTTIDVRPQTKLNEGENVTISCQTDSSPEGHVTLIRMWNGEETKLVSSNGTHTSFSIPFTNMSHTGIYVCEAVNKYGHQRTQNVQITVHAPPRDITVRVYPSKEVQEGGNITICCQSVSFPPSAITLKKLESENYIYSPSGTFLLVNLTSVDSGQYQVNATNALGYEIEIFTITVTSKRQDHESIITVLLRRMNSPDFIIPVIGLGALAAVASFLDFIRRAKRKGFYELTADKQETV